VPHRPASSGSLFLAGGEVLQVMCPSAQFLAISSRDAKFGEFDRLLFLNLESVKRAAESLFLDLLFKCRHVPDSGRNEPGHEKATIGVVGARAADFEPAVPG